jgi:DNA-binding response OmpR family regulator
MASRAKRILLVDDEAALRAALKRALTNAGYVVEEAEDGRIALRMYRQTPTDMVILDILMPDKEGLATISELRGIDRDVPVIAISAGGIGSADDYLEAALAFGASRILRKPFPLAELLSAVTELFDETSVKTD